MFIPLILAALLSASAPVPQQFADVLLSVAVPDAIECGVVTLEQDQTDALACVLEALKGGRAFRVAVQGQGEDSEF